MVLANRASKGSVDSLGGANFALADGVNPRSDRREWRAASAFSKVTKAGLRRRPSSTILPFFWMSFLASAMRWYADAANSRMWKSAPSRIPSFSIKVQACIQNLPPPESVRCAGRRIIFPVSFPMVCFGRAFGPAPPCDWLRFLPSLSFSMALVDACSNDFATDYALRVVQGQTPCGPLVLGACKKHLAELETQGTEEFPYVYDATKLGRYMAFCKLLVQFEGEWSGKPLSLMPWQLFVSGSLLCWVRRDNGYRRFRSAYIEVARKNGKSAWAASLSLFFLMLDGEHGAQILCLATKKDQAKIVYEGSLKFIRGRLSEKVRTAYGQTEFPITNSIYKPLAANSRKADGLNCHFACADELHEWPDAGLWDVVQSSMSARRQPLMFGITTAGFARQGLAVDMRAVGKTLCDDAGRRDSVLDARFSYIAAPSESDEDIWWEPRVWVAANPSFGLTKKEGWFKERVEEAMMQPSKQAEFKTKDCNIWCGASKSWLNAEAWKGLAVDAGEFRESLVGAPCFGGMDLAKVSDFTSFVLYFKPSGPSGIRARHRILSLSWLPEDILNRRDCNPLYRQWVDAGHLRLTHGNATDFATIRADIINMLDGMDVQAIGYDRWAASETVQYLQGHGISMHPVTQGFALDSALRELERLVVGGSLAHDGNPLLAWQAANATLARNRHGLVAICKDQDALKIDAVAAAADAISVAIATPDDASEPMMLI